MTAGPAGETGLAAAYLDAAAGGRLVLPRCEACGRFHWYPKLRCPHCRSGRWSWAEAGRTGTVFTFTTVSHPFRAGSRPPFTIGLVEPDAAAGVRLVTRLVDVEPEQIRIGLAVEVDFRPIEDGGPRLPVFRPAGPL